MDVLYTAEALSTGGGRDGRVTTVHLEAVLPELEPQLAHELADAAHQVCPYSNATRGNIEVTVAVSDD